MKLNVNAYARAYIQDPTNFSMAELYQSVPTKETKKTLHQARQT